MAFGSIVLTEIPGGTGDIAHMDGYTIRVESVRGHRITAVRIREHRADAAADEIP